MKTKLSKLIEAESALEKIVSKSASDATYPEKLSSGVDKWISLTESDLSALKGTFDKIVSTLEEIMDAGGKLDYLSSHSIRFLNELYHANLSGDIFELNKQAEQVVKDLKEILSAYK